MKFPVLFLIAIALASCTDEVTEISISPLENSIVLNEAVSFKTNEDVPESFNLHWDFGDGTISDGSVVDHEFLNAGIYHVRFYQEISGEKVKKSSAIVRVHTSKTHGLPQVLLDTDARNEIDDQNYITYALYSGVDVLAVNSIHNGEDFSEDVNYGEIYYVFRKLWYSDFPKETPKVFRGAPKKLERPESDIWTDTEPIVTDASNAIMAAARGASPENPVYIIPVGPCTNIASALLQAKATGFDMSDRIRVLWLGGGPESAGEETYNGRNDPWSVYVVGQSGVDFTIILENPTSAKLKFHKNIDGKRYPDNEIGQFLRTDILSLMDLWDEDTKSLYDLTTISAVISNHLHLNWLTEVEDMSIGKENHYEWLQVEGESDVHIVREINYEAMKEDFFTTINGNPIKLIK